MVPLKQLLDGVPVLEVSGDLDVSVGGVEHHSGRVEPGMLFVLTLEDSPRARNFLSEALRRGAVAVVVQPSMAPFLRSHFPDLPRVTVASARRALGRILRNWYGDLRLQLIGVTGTNGKTSVAWFLHQLLAAADHPAAVIGTLGVYWNGRWHATGYTTPDPVILWQWLQKLSAAGVRFVAMETSSHALDQHRTEGLSFAAGVLTNLTQDHLDYHGTMEQYAAAKARLFQQLSETAVAIFNRDDPWTPFFQRHTRATVRFYGQHPEAFVRIEAATPAPDGLTATLRIGEHRHELTLPFLAPFMVWNLAAALCVVDALGISVEKILPVLPHLSPPPGRLEPFALPNGAFAVVDYAHTPDALRKLLEGLRQWMGTHRKRLICVFGCGGDRDRQKRPLMGAIAAQRADLVIITSDNPRTEDPARIAADIVAGVPAALQDKMIVELDRTNAIVTALSLATSEDVVCIAGKGHEQEQIIGTQRIPFSDQQVVREWVAKEGKR